MTDRPAPKVEVEVQQCLRVSAPHWFGRADFQAWLDLPATATWHHKGTHDPYHEYDDAFVNYDDGESGDADSLPDDVWAEIDARCKEAGVRQGVVWISPV